MSDESTDSAAASDRKPGRSPRLPTSPQTKKREPERGSPDTLGSFLRRIFLDPVFLALVLATIPLSVWGVMRTAADPNDTGALTAFLLTGTAVLPTAWSILCPLWKEDAKVAIMVSLVRTIVVPIVVCWPPAVTVLITVSQADVMQQIVETRRPDGWRYFFGGEDGGVVQQAIVLGGLAGMIFAMLTALALSVFVVLPVLAWFKPLGAAESNMMMTATKEDQAAAKSGIRMLSVILMMTFAVPALIIFGKNNASARSWYEAFATAPRFFAEPEYFYGDVMWVVGILAIPVGILLIVWLRRVQRPDLRKRAEWGVNSWEDRRRWKRLRGREALESGASSEPREAATGAVEGAATESEAE